jgi:hypothetical protein
MTEDQFWDLIESTNELGEKEQLSALRANLEKLSIEEVEAFETVFCEQMNRSYSWDLWGAAYLINDGASEEGFHYFRLALIAKGRAVFEEAVADPDSLADILAPGDGDLEFEEFAYVARRVWSGKTGQPGEEMPEPAVDYKAKPSGAALEVEEAHLASRYPKLWRRYGEGAL